MTNLRGATQPQIVERSAANLPQTAQTPYFTVTGRVLIIQIVGEVETDVIGAMCIALMVIF